MNARVPAALAALLLAACATPPADSFTMAQDAMRRAAIQHSVLHTYEPTREAALPAWLEA